MGKVGKGVKSGFTATIPNSPTPLWIPAFAGMTEWLKGFSKERVVFACRTRFCKACSELAEEPAPHVRRGLHVGEFFPEALTDVFILP